jgi:RNA polymerase sigma-54 factor
MVDHEEQKKPLSDQIICNRLNIEGMNISRRTVAKYREELMIKSSSKRKRF